MAGPNDFVLPGIPTLEPAKVDYGPLLRAEESNVRTAEKQQANIGAAAGVAEKVGNAIYGLGEASAMASAQKDALDLRLQTIKDASDLASKGQFTYANQNEEAGGGEIPQDQRESNKTLQLDPAFEQSIRNNQQAVSDKYKQYPKVQEWILGKYSDYAEEAYKVAVSKAAEAYKANGQKQTLGTLDSLVQDGVQSRSMANVDAFLDGKTLSTFWSPAEIDDLRLKAHREVMDGIVSSDLNRDVHEQGLDAALSRLESIKGIDEKTRAQFEEQARRVENLEQGAANKVVLTRATDLVGKGMTVFDAVDKASEGIPDFRTAKAQEAAKSYLTSRQQQFDADATSKVTAYAFGDGVNEGHGWAETERWFTDPAN